MKSGLGFRLRLTALALLAIAPLVKADDFTYITNADDTITITGYTGSSGDLTIPNTTNGMPVTSIGDYAFSWRTDLISVTIPDSVSTIGVGTFYVCTNLTNVMIGNNVTNIGPYAFWFCTGLRSITIPNSVTTIWSGTFQNCTGLTNVTIGSNVTSIESQAFRYCTSLTAITIPDSVTSIEAQAFRYCTSLTSITIPDSVTGIGGEAFYYCSSLTNVMIGNGVISIGDQVFESCTGLTEVYFRGDAPILGLDVFAYCSAPVYYLPNTTGWNTWPVTPSTVLWKPRIETGNDGFFVQTNGFGFNIAWARGMTIVVETCTNLAEGLWVPVETNTLSGSSIQFRDPVWTNHPSRYYRVSMP